MKLGRYHHRPQPETLSELKKKSFQSFRSSGSLPRNPELTSSLKLPALQMKRSSSIVSLVSQRNTKITVEKMEKEMFKFQNDLSRERINTNQCIKSVQSLREEYLQNQLTKLHEGFKGEIKNLRKYFEQKKKEHEVRSLEIRKDYNVLWQRTEELRQQLFQVRMRVQRIEREMGEES